MASVAFIKPSAEGWVSEVCRLCNQFMSPEDSTTHAVDEKVKHTFHIHCLQIAVTEYPNCPGCNRHVVAINGVPVNVELTFEEFQSLARIHLETVDPEDVYNVQFDGVTFKEFLASLNKLYSASKRGELLTVSQWLLNEHSSYRAYCIRESLVVAAKYGRTAVVHMLIDEETIPFLWCKRALDFATEKKNFEVSQLLVSHMNPRLSRMENIRTVQIVAAFALACVVYNFSHRYIFG